MRVTLKKVACFVALLYLVLTSYAAYILLSDKFSKSKITDDLPLKNLPKHKKSRPSHHAMTPKPQQVPKAEDTLFEKPVPIKKASGKGDIALRLDQLRPVKQKAHEVEMWSRVGVGHYTWQHLLDGPLEPRLGGVWSFGVKRFRDMEFKFRMGPGVHQTKAPQDVQNLILVLNGRAPDKIQFARSWLDYLGNYKELKNMALMIIGSELCDDDWLLPYMASHGGPVKLLFIVYDSNIVNGRDIIQWPLGVATYRGFPVVDSSTLALHMPRSYRCNFMGTVYRNSSREDLMSMVWQNHLSNVCYVKTRASWEPSEKAETREEYQRILAQSDLTLSPVGQNTECYRLYEACAYGSIPVIEDIRTPGNCDEKPLRLLKQMGAPFIFIKRWSELPEILKKEERRTQGEIVQRRRELVQWYDTFKERLKEVFLDKIQDVFVTHSNNTVH